MDLNILDEALPIYTKIKTIEEKIKKLQDYIDSSNREYFITFFDSEDIRLPSKIEIFGNQLQIDRRMNKIDLCLTKDECVCIINAYFMALSGKMNEYKQIIIEL